jgi:large subunit ribosomal protein L9
MKILLLKTVNNLGQAGEIKEVSEGYARNFLLTKGLAEIVTRHSERVLIQQKQKKAKLKSLEVRSKKSEIKKLAGKIFAFTLKADEKGTLYEKLGAKKIAEELFKQGYKVESSEIKLEKPIKKTGDYDVVVELAGEKAAINLKVIKS